MLDTKTHYLKTELYDRIAQADGLLFEFLQEAALDGIWYWDLENPTEEWLSPKFKSLFGYEKGEVPNTSAWWQENIHAEDLPGVLEAFEKHKQDPESPYDQVVRYRHKDGSIVWVRCRGVILRDEQGKPLRMLGAHTDVTELEEAKLRIETLNLELASEVAKLQRANADLSEFTHIASHDLKAPLRGISNYAAFLQQDYSDKLDDDGQRMLEALPRLCGRLDRLITDILDYSRIGNREMACIPVQLEKTIQEARGLLGITTENKSVEIECPADLPAVQGDPTRLSQAFQFLIGNSIKFNDNELQEVKIRAQDDPDRDGRVLISIEDNGIGIDAEFHEQVFRMFRRLHGPSEYGGGSGSGLAIVRRIIDRHEGRIWMDSAPGKGTTVHFTLERAKE